MARLQSLDVLRGLTVAGMILVNNGPKPSFVTLRHSDWNGLTPCDLVFPFFLFMVGVSIFLSMNRHAGEMHIKRKILRRSLLLFGIGVALHACEMLVNGHGADIPERLRLWGVLQRIGLSYLFASLIFNFTKGRYLWWIAMGLLLLYTAILMVGNGYSLDQSQNLLWQVDHQLFGNHLYHKAITGRSPVDPEGLLGVIPSIAHTLIGVACGRDLMRYKGVTEKVTRVLVLACALALLGWLFSFALPINKRIWSPTYVFVTCGMAAALLGLFTWCIDGRPDGYVDTYTERLSAPCFQLFRWFGLNSLSVYVLSEMLSPILGATGLTESLFGLYHSLWGADWGELASLSYALTYVALMGLVAWLLYRKQIFIKI